MHGDRHALLGDLERDAAPDPPRATGDERLRDLDLHGRPLLRRPLAGPPTATVWTISGARIGGTTGPGGRRREWFHSGHAERWRSRLVPRTEEPWHWYQGPHRTGPDGRPVQPAFRGRACRTGNGRLARRLEVDHRLAFVRVQQLLAHGVRHLQPLFLGGQERVALVFGVPNHDDDVLAVVFVIDDVEADEAVGRL